MLSMDVSKVVIRLVIRGEKLYIIGMQPSSLSFKKSKNPFSDNEISKYTLEQAKEMFPIIQRWYPIGIVQIVDISGKTIDTSDSLHNVINEEIQKFLNEDITINNDDFRFTNELRMSGTTENPEIQINFRNYSSFSNDYDINILDAYITVTWKVGFEVNSNGVKNFFINVENVDGQYRIEMRDRQSDEVVQTTDKNIADTQWKFEVDDETLLKVNGGLFVKEIVFDFANNRCVLVFKPPQI
jgi:hypothetical protein